MNLVNMVSESTLVDGLAMHSENIKMRRTLQKFRTLSIEG